MQYTKTLKGLTLIEVVVAMAVFSILMVGAAQTFTSGLMSFKQNTDIEREVENVSASMNQIAKELRTSTVRDYTGTSSGAKINNPATLTYYDHSQGKCIYYSSSSGSLATPGIVRRQEKTVPNTTFTSVLTDCIGGFGAVANVTPADTKLELSLNESTTGKVGGVRMVFTLNASGKSVAIQSFVSSRDYKKSGL